MGKEIITVSTIVHFEAKSFRYHSHAIRNTRKSIEHKSNYT
jgi:hypothetical protein